MSEEPENLVLAILREMRLDMKSEFLRPDSTLQDVRRHVVSLDLRVEALDEKFETIREGAVSAIGYAAHASRAHGDLRQQIAELTHRVEVGGGQVMRMCGGVGR